MRKLLPCILLLSCLITACTEKRQKEAATASSLKDTPGDSFMISWIDSNINIYCQKEIHRLPKFKDTGWVREYKISSSKYSPLLNTTRYKVTDHLASDGNIYYLLRDHSTGVVYSFIHPGWGSNTLLHFTPKEVNDLFMRDRHVTPYFPDFNKFEDYLSNCKSLGESAYGTSILDTAFNLLFEEISGGQIKDSEALQEYVTAQMKDMNEADRQETRLLLENLNKRLKHPKVRLYQYYGELIYTDHSLAFNFTPNIFLDSARGSFLKKFPRTSNENIQLRVVFIRFTENE